MSEKICPFMSRVAIGMGDTLMTTPCIKEKCMAWKMPSVQAALQQRMVNVCGYCKLIDGCYGRGTEEHC